MGAFLSTLKVMTFSAKSLKILHPHTSKIYGSPNVQNRVDYLDLPYPPPLIHQPAFFQNSFVRFLNI